MIAMFGIPGGGEWILIVLVILLLFGARKIPDLMKGIGGGIKEFKKAAKDEDDSSKNEKEKLESKETSK